MLAAIGCRFKRQPFRLKSSSSIIDRSKVPTIKEADLEESFISGHGPGGQKVNKSLNCCQIKHLPTGIVIKSHQSRLLKDNRKIAREILIERLDKLYNGENSVADQKLRIAREKAAKQAVEAAKKRQLKAELKQLVANDRNNGERVPY